MGKPFKCSGAGGVSKGLMKKLNLAEMFIFFSTTSNDVCLNKKTLFGKTVFMEKIFKKTKKDFMGKNFDFFSRCDRLKKLKPLLLETKRKN